ncbi:hypothetical protein [Pseudarthrobacter sp. NamB4]|uniref:hypothetical protein n=1 Tax=Pseudarthrobacter sp. NamB4 TaxID=2576837 RepID=UPI0010FEFC18|nr:hypothetical protein [Pseudarthrobacter sp. NamB4]TLM72628.1 hypothetical protein FDW81_12700 [Pseudarthrobacter sp. NamB4]
MSLWSHLKAADIADGGQAVLQPAAGNMSATSAAIPRIRHPVFMARVHALVEAASASDKNSRAM